LIDIFPSSTRHEESRSKTGGFDVSICLGREPIPALQSRVAESHCTGISNCGLESASKVDRNLAGQTWFGGRSGNNGVF
jgi:hypothetical protein